MNQLIKFSNNASVRISKAVKIGDKKIYVNAGDTAFFPTIKSNGEFFILCLVNSSTGAFEIMKCIATESDAFIVERALEGTTEIAFPEGSLIENRLTAGSIQNIFNFTKASKDDAGLVYVGDYNDLVSDSLTREPVVPDVNAVKQYVKQYVGNNGFIAGGIIAFSGTFIDGYPVPYGKTKADKNWHICDGTSNTPDLRNRFIMGANTPSDIGQTGGNNVMSGTTGPCTLSEAQLPAHSHPTGLRWGGKFGKGGLYGINGDKGGPYSTASVGKSQSHTHPLSTSSDNRPAFYTLAYIMKIK